MRSPLTGCLLLAPTLLILFVFGLVPFFYVLVVGFTDARVFRHMGAVAYGAGLFSPDVDRAEFGRRFHGNDERVDVESLALTTNLWLDVTRDLLG